MIYNVISHLWRHKSVMVFPALVVTLSVLTVIFLVLWDLSLVNDALASENTIESSQSVASDIQVLQKTLSAIKSNTEISEKSVQDALAGLSRKYGVTVREIRRYERTSRKKTQLFIDIDLVGGYPESLKSLRSIESWTDLKLTRVEIKADTDNPRFVVLSLGLVEL
ncbi:MAG: hypothetical protein IIB00_08290 [candidate division Zixibacteria bacterium]|nr:hypothetical protein [candidate division Zixibacteria bacterium]